MNATSRGDETNSCAAATSQRRLDRAMIARLAAERGWTNTSQIATGLGIARATYFRLLRGDAGPRLDTAHRMARRAEVTVDDLFPPQAA